MEFMKALAKRRSVYALGNDLDLPDEAIADMIGECVKLTPSAFNAQNQRVVVMFGKHHERLWDIVFEEVKKVAPEEQLASSKEKIDGFKAARGSVLFFDEQTITHDLMERFPLYKENFKRWSIEQLAMLQNNVWARLAENDIGASLQHYGTLIETRIKEEYQVPDTWKLYAQMPFGNILEKPESKEKEPIDKRMMVLY